MRKLVTLLLLSAAAVVLAVGTAVAGGRTAGAPSSPVALNAQLAQGPISMSGPNEPASGAAPDIQVYECNDHNDNDSDGYIDYPFDPGCASFTDDDESNPPPPPPPPPPPLPPPPPPPDGWPYTMIDVADRSSTESDECENGQPLNPKLPAYPCLGPDGQPTSIRCKVYVWVETPHEGHFGIDFGKAIKFEGRWKICYRPNGGGITSVVYRTSRVSETYRLWQSNGNDDGFPYHIRDAHAAYVYYSAGAQVCIGGSYGCSPVRHILVTFTFRDTGLYGSITRVVNMT